VSSKSYNNITSAIFSCVKTTSEREHGTVYNPPDANQGTATTVTAVGKVVLSFDLNPATDVLSYSITSKPFIVPESTIWNGITGTINGCSS
jgi:hypothetical protein